MTYLKGKPHNGMEVCDCQGRSNLKIMMHSLKG